MNVEQFRELCLSMPMATEDFPFDESVLVFRVGGHIFAMIDLSDTRWCAVKCDPDKAVELRDRYPQITPAYHMNKRHWNQLDIEHLSDALIGELVSHSHTLIVAKLTKRVRAALNL